MADLLWESYREVGYWVFVQRYHSKNDRGSDHKEALMYVSLGTYKQFCKTHNIDVSWLRV